MSIFKFKIKIVYEKFTHNSKIFINNQFLWGTKKYVEIFDEKKFSEIWYKDFFILHTSTSFVLVLFGTFFLPQVCFQDISKENNMIKRVKIYYIPCFIQNLKLEYNLSFYHYYIFIHLKTVCVPLCMNIMYL